VRVAEQHATAREFIDVRRFDARVSAKASDPVVHIVDGEKEYVRTFGSGECRGCREAREELASGSHRFEGQS
jgi:hypothetical protein